MTRRRTVYGYLALALMTSMSSMATAQDTEKKKAGKEADPAAMMAAYEKAAEPAEQHKLLQKQVGKWNLSLKSWPAPGAPAMESNGTAETKSLLGDRYVQTQVTSDMMGKPFTGIGTTGYDKAKKKFVGTWIDSMSTGMMLSEGTADAAGKVFTTQAVSTDPLSGKQTKMRIVSKWESDDKIVEEFYEKKGGKDVKTMEITYTRAK
jgi:hypothetical protein